MELEAVAPNTITDPDALKGEVETVRRQGFAVDNEEFLEGVNSLRDAASGQVRAHCRRRSRSRDRCQRISLETGILAPAASESGRPTNSRRCSSDDRGRDRHKDTGAAAPEDRKEILPDRHLPQESGEDTGDRSSRPVRSPSVQEMLARIEAEGEDAVRDYALKLDKWDGDHRRSPKEEIEARAASGSPAGQG